MFRLLFKIAPVVAGSALVGWASHGGVPAASTIRAAIIGAATCSLRCTRTDELGALAQPATHKPKTVAVGSKPRVKSEPVRQPRA